MNFYVETLTPNQFPESGKIPVTVSFDSTIENLGHSVKINVWVPIDTNLTDIQKSAVDTAILYLKDAIKSHES